MVFQLVPRGVLGVGARPDAGIDTHRSMNNFDSIAVRGVLRIDTEQHALSRGG
jgi:hypothetical protein